eukprot:2692476-Amphidinium_carterae.2
MDDASVKKETSLENNEDKEENNRMETIMKDTGTTLQLLVIRARHHSGLGAQGAGHTLLVKDATNKELHNY